MIFLSDIKKLFELCDDKYAVMCVKHNHIPLTNSHKMDGREQLRYHRKNWSSFVLWNCSHPANANLTEDRVNYMKGCNLHAFTWLDDTLIGALPYTYNFISGVSPKMPPESGGMPRVIHYTEGGPWFDTCKDVPYGGQWIEEYEDMQRNGDFISNVPSASYELEEVIRK
jgi:lipopolysaccharide biosynthesis glycosyltransferase